MAVESNTAIIRSYLIVRHRCYGAVAFANYKLLSISRDHLQRMVTNTTVVNNILSLSRLEILTQIIAIFIVKVMYKWFQTNLRLIVKRGQPDTESQYYRNGQKLRLKDNNRFGNCCILGSLVGPMAWNLKVSRFNARHDSILLSRLS